MHPYYVIRVGGGLLYLSGALIMAWNLGMTMRGRCATKRRWAALPSTRRATSRSSPPLAE